MILSRHRARSGRASRRRAAVTRGGSRPVDETWLGVPAGDLLPGSRNPSSRKPHSHSLRFVWGRAENQCAASSALT